MTETAFLASARRLEPMVTELRGQFDQDRQLPGRLIDELSAANLFRMWLPLAIGGAELPPLQFLTVIEELSRQDGSLGWCTVIPAGYGRLAGALEEDVARTIFGTGKGVLAGTLNPTGKAVAAPGGYRVTGRWSYGSSIGFSDWVLGNCITEDATGPCRAADGGPEFRLCLFPRAEVEVFDIWHVSGLRATGSNNFQVTDLFVPQQHTIPLVDFQPPPRRPGPLYATPMTSTFVSCLASVALGIARAAIESVIEIGAAKKTAGSSTVLRDKPLAQADLARAEGLVGAGRAYLFSELGMMWEDAVAGRAISLRARGQVRLAACHAMQSAIQAVDLMFQAAGGAALFQGSRLERCFRDIHTAGQHIAVSMQANVEPVGRVLFGLPPGMARF
jgi:indole-3-acetate monooxygenase